MKMIYWLNGWRTSRTYFMSFGWTRDEFERMEQGDEIVRDGNTFGIEVVEK